MKVRFTRRATRQLDAILGPLAIRSPAGATGVARHLSEVARILSDQPLVGRATARARRVAFVLCPYVIDYRVDGGEIVIQDIRYTRRDSIP